MFGWSERNTLNRFLNSTFTGCNLKMFDLPLVVSLHFNIELYVTVIIWIAPLKTAEQIKHSLNSICASEMSNMINYRLKALQMTRRLMLTNILP